MSRQIFNVSAFKTASRCWIPVNTMQATMPATLRHFSSKQRCVNFNNINDISVVLNDVVMSTPSEEPDFESFEPTVFSSEDFHTAGPVNKA